MPSWLEIRTFGAQVETTHRSSCEQVQKEKELNTHVKQLWDLESVGIANFSATEMTLIEKLA